MKELIEKSEINYHLPNNPEARARLNKLCHLIVEECIQAVRNADEHHAYTTFDRGQIRATKDRCIMSIQDKFGL